MAERISNEGTPGSRSGLPEERERELWALCRTGDPVAREELIVAYRPLVFWLAGKIHAAPSLRQDIIQEGMLALIRAVDRFDPDREFRFSTYACHRIRGQMLNMLERSERKAPIPVPDEWIQVAPRDPEDEDWLDVAESIAHLQGREAEVVSALFFEGKAPRDVAAEQRLDVSHVYRLRRAAIAHIRAWLGLPVHAIKAGESGISC
ncbi:MAG: sigma-70 family RNA polymerase sigma factor [Fretibacterium sp.]|nr:sigma-70 family RNA polymerase sigma factor [Fretibacterium sp.]